jgi:putative intracellular protease/amidase/ketosteroid isomerase-like protein
MSRLIVLVSSAGGYWAEGALAAQERFAAAGFEPVVVTPDGEPPTIDPTSLDPVFHHAEEDADFLASVIRSFAPDPEDVRVTLADLAGLDLIAARRIFEELRGAGWPEPEARGAIEEGARRSWREGRNFVERLAADGRVAAAVPAETLRRVADGLRLDSAREAAGVAERLASIPAFQKPLPLTGLTDGEIAGSDGVFVPGGHGALTEMSSNPAVGLLLRRLHAGGRVIATVSHGAAALLAAGGRPDGAWLFDGFRLAACTNEEQAQMPGAPGDLRFSVEDALKNAGAIFDASGSPWASHVVVDRNVITAQNPMSARAAVDAVLKRLGAYEDAALPGFAVRRTEERVDDPLVLAREFFARLDRHDLDGALALLDPAAAFEVLPVRLSGRAEPDGRVFLEDLLSAFPDLLVRVSNAFAGTGATAVAEIVMEGTQAADFHGVLNQRKHMDLRQAWLLTVGDGQVRRLRAYWCQNQLYRRLGVRRYDALR